MTDLGMIAYNAYGDTRNWRTFADEPMPTWDDQTDELRDAWRKAANAVAATVRREVISNE